MMESPLHKVVTYGNVQAVQDLIKNGVKIDFGFLSVKLRQIQQF